MKKSKMKWLNILVPAAALAILALILFAPDRGGGAATGDNTLLTGLEWVSSNYNTIQLPYDTALQINDTLASMRQTQSVQYEDQPDRQGMAGDTLMLLTLSIILAIGSINIISTMLQTSSIRAFLNRRIHKKSISSGCLWTIDIKGMIHISSSHQVKIA